MAKKKKNPLCLVAFHGEAGSGKDSIVDGVLKSINGTGLKIALADPLKRFLREVYGFRNEQLWGSSGNRNSIASGVVLRQALQSLGTEWGRGLWADTWVNLLLRTCEALEKGGVRYTQEEGLLPDPHVSERPNVVLVTDVRFRNEAQLLREHGAKIVRIVRELPKRDEAFRSHISENDMAEASDDDFDRTIVNEDLDKAILEATHIVNHTIESSLTRSRRS